MRFILACESTVSREWTLHCRSALVFDCWTWPGKLVLYSVCDILCSHSSVQKKKKKKTKNILGKMEKKNSEAFHTFKNDYQIKDNILKYSWQQSWRKIYISRVLWHLKKIKAEWFIFHSLLFFPPILAQFNNL